MQKTRFFAQDAKFGEAEREAFGIVWQEDLFAEGDEDNRFTIDGEAFVSAQRAWVDANMPKNGVWIEIDEYGREKLPPRANRTWAKPKKGDQIGFAINPRDGKIQEVVFRISEPDVTKGKDRSIGGGDDAPAPKKTRPEITQKGTEIIGALRTEALVKSLEVNACDDMTLIGLLVLAFDAKNVTVQTDRPTHSTRTKLIQSITEGGRLTQDAERLRVVARQMLATVLSCSLGRGDSGLVARIAGDALGADAHIGNMATEDFLGCLSKAGIEKVGSSLRVLPRPRAKDTRAEVIKQASGTTYVIPRPCSRSPKRNSRSTPKRHGNIRGVSISREDDQEGAGDDAGETEGDEAPAPTEGAGSHAELRPRRPRGEWRRRRRKAHLDSDLDEDEAPVIPIALVPRGVSTRPRPDRQRPGHPSEPPRRRLEAGAYLFPEVIAMIHAQPHHVRPRRETFSTVTSPAANPKALIEDAFRRGFRLGLSIRAASRGCPTRALLYRRRRVMGHDDRSSRTRLLNARRIALPSISSSIASARRAAESGDCDPTRWSRAAWRRYLYAAAHAPSLVDLERVLRKMRPNTQHVDPISLSDKKPASLCEGRRGSSFQFYNSNSRIWIKHDPTICTPPQSTASCCSIGSPQGTRARVLLKPSYFAAIAHRLQEPVLDDGRPRNVDYA